MDQTNETEDQTTDALQSDSPTRDSVIMCVDHVAVAVTDLEASIAWYRDCLGFTLLERRSTRGERTGMISAVMSAGRAIVVLIQGTEPESQVSRFIEKCGPGVQHVALEVTDIHVALRRLQSEGAKVVTPLIEDEGIRQVFLERYPGSGVRVELIEKRGGTFSDATVRQLFLGFERQDLY